MLKPGARVILRAVDAIDDLPPLPEQRGEIVDGPEDWGGRPVWRVRLDPEFAADCGDDVVFVPQDQITEA